MRPSIDVPHEFNGTVKDYAEAKDIGLSEAYMVLVKRGLENDGGGER